MEAQLIWKRTPTASSFLKLPHYECRYKDTLWQICLEYKDDCNNDRIYRIKGVDNQGNPFSLSLLKMDDALEFKEVNLFEKATLLVLEFCTPI